MLLCVTGTKNGYKCVKYFIFHFFSHISWKIGLPLCFIIFMLSLGINLLVKKLFVRHCSRCSSDFEVVHNVPSDFEVVHNVTSVL